MRFFQKNKKGFTLVETLIAISILLVGVSAAFSAAQSGLSSTIAVKDRVAAIFLAQEAMEAVRNLKDSNLLAENNATPPSNNNPHWLNGLANSGDPCAGGASCDYDFNPNHTLPAFIACNTSCFLRINSAGEYVHSSGTQSKFRRFITVEEISSGAPKEARVTVTVNWAGQTVTVRDSLFNWFAPE